MPSLDLNNTFGALLIGTVVSAVLCLTSRLYGITCIQTWRYFQNYSDGAVIKSSGSCTLIYTFSCNILPLLDAILGSLTVLESVLETLHSAFSIHAIYFYVILNYANPTALAKATWSAAAVLIVTDLITAIVHLFFIWRIYLVSRKNVILAAFLVLLELARFGAGFSVPIMALKLQLFQDFHTLPEIVVPQDVSLSLSTAIDVIIAGSLSFYLHFSRTGIKSTDILINRLVVYAINNGTVTSVADILCLIFGTVQGNNLIYLSIYQCIGNLYTNSMLATLNSRHSVTAGHVMSTSLELSGMNTSHRSTKQASMFARSQSTTLDVKPRDDESQNDKQISLTIHKTTVTSVV
ncbi:hypothetical protein BDZ97DRAFT_2060841 [Flammula alnicola]|nr:hypothetical protein BDZ97DRAFT_2060841 [Flammula alnicola]